MKKIKKLFIGIAVFMLMMCVLCFSVSAAEEGDFTYTVKNREATLTAVNTAAVGNVVIPDTLGGYPVTRIEVGAISGCNSMETLVIPGSVKTIAPNAILECENLKSVTILDGVTEIGRYTIIYCPKLETITIPASVTNMGAAGIMSSDTPFGENESLKRIIVDENNEYYSSDAFGVLYNKEKTKLMLFPEGSEVTSYVIPDTVVEIVRFEGRMLKELTVSEGITNLGGVFYGCVSLESVIIPKSVTQIVGAEFYYCENLKNIYFEGSQEEWNSAIEKIYGIENHPLLKATVHYGEASHIHYYASVTTPATCTANGQTVYSCSCGNTYTEIIPTTDHSYQNGVCSKCGDSRVDDCSHLCHKSGFMGFIWKIVRFFWKLFKMNPVCECGLAHY